MFRTGTNPTLLTRRRHERLRRVRVRHWLSLTWVNRAGPKVQYRLGNRALGSGACAAHDARQ
jgi:hypothetical protein